MTYSTGQKSNNKITTLILVLGFILLSSISAFSQSVANSSFSDDNTIETATIVTKQSSSVKSNNMEFVLWFMGSKQNPNSTLSNESNNSAKNQIMTSGLAPNRLLIKAFLKKAVNFESSVA